MISLHSGAATAVSFVALASLAGCETLGALSFQKADQSGVSEPQIVALHYVSAMESDRFQIVQAGTEIEELKEKINSCKVAGFAPLAVPFIVAGAQLVFGFATDSLSSMVERLRARGQRTYSSREFFNDLPKDIPGCLVQFRYAEQSQSSSGVTQIDRIGLASIFRKRQVGLGHLWCLDYLWMDNSVAVTAKGDPPNVKVSFAVVEKAVQKASDFSEIKNLGQGTITVGKVGLTGTGASFGGDEAKFKYCTNLFGAPLVTSSRVVLEWNEDVLRRNGIPIFELRDNGQGQWAVVDLKAGDFWRDYPAARTHARSGLRGLGEEGLGLLEPPIPAQRFPQKHTH